MEPQALEPIPNRPSGEITTRKGLNVTAFVRARFDGADMKTAAKVAGSLAKTDDGLKGAAAAIRSHPQYADVVEAERRRRAPDVPLTLEHMTRLLLKWAESPVAKESLHAIAELRKLLMGDGRAAGALDTRQQAAASSLLEALALTASRTGQRVSLSAEPPSAPPEPPTVVDVQVEPSPTPLPSTEEPEDQGSEG